MVFSRNHIAKFRSLFNKSCSARFQILSDLHLEIGQQYSSFEVPPSAPYLVLAGDIGRLIDYDAYLAFLAKQTANFQKVFLVLGNHEFYGLSTTTGLSRAATLAQEPVLDGKLVLLNQTRFDIPNSPVTILGCTLWSSIPESARDVVRLRVKDFQKIEGRTVDAHNADYEADVTWLKGQVAKLREEDRLLAGEKADRRILVVTHHAPCVQETSRPEHASNAWSSAFATEVLGDGSGAEWEAVKAWVFGHTHYSTAFRRGGVRVVSNQRGYVLPGSVGSGNRARAKDETVFDMKRVISV